MKTQRLLYVVIFACFAIAVSADERQEQQQETGSESDQRLARVRRHRQRQQEQPSSDNNVQRMQSDDTSSQDVSIQRLKQLVINSGDRVVDFERGRHMDANDEAVQQVMYRPADNDTLKAYAERNCTSCLMREEAKLGRIERIKADLLQKLGFKNAPNTTARDAPPTIPNLQGILVKWGFNSDNSLSADAAMAADEADRVDLRPEDYEAKTERVYAFATKPPTFIGLNDETQNQTVYFQFSAETMNNHVDNAQLHVYVSTGDVDPNIKLTMEVFLVDNLEGKKSIVDTKVIRRTSSTVSHWEKVAVTKQVRHWFSKPLKNYGLIVRVMHNGTNLVNMPVSHTVQGENQMYLDIVTKDGAKSRPKRSVVKLDCQEKDNETRCCRYPLVLDFESFGWDWVIAPKKYLAYYCSGECPFRHLQRYLHTHLVQQANPRGNAGPCCYPTQMAPILMVYFNENKEVLVSKVPGMVVTRCGCA